MNGCCTAATAFEQLLATRVGSGERPELSIPTLMTAILSMGSCVQCNAFYPSG